VGSKPITAFGTDATLGFSQAVRVGDLLFVSGQVAWDAERRVVGIGDASRQAEQAFANLVAVLKANGSSVDRVVKLTLFATSRDHLAPLREMRKRVFGATAHFPASTFVVVSGLAAPDLLVEVEAVAHVGESG